MRLYYNLKTLRLQNNTQVIQFFVPKLSLTCFQYRQMTFHYWLITTKITYKNINFYITFFNSIHAAPSLFFLFFFYSLFNFFFLSFQYSPYFFYLFFIFLFFIFIFFHLFLFNLVPCFLTSLLFFLFFFPFIYFIYNFQGHLSKMSNKS